MSDYQFLFNTELVAGLENLIKNAKHKLILISPFIDLSKEIKLALNQHIGKHDFELFVLFGKNEDNLYKSIKRDSFDFFKQFPNVEIRYDERLHAKFYQNDFDFIMSSINLYDYSLAKNIEVGIKCSHASKGLLGKVFDGTDVILTSGIDKVKNEVLGITSKEIDPVNKFHEIFGQAELKYKTQPVKIEKSSISGFFGAKELNGFNVIVDKLSITKSLVKETYKPKVGTVINNAINNNSISDKPLSASQLSKNLGVTQAEITGHMTKSGLIDGDKITTLGQSKGLVTKNYMGKDYIAYPENLVELNQLVKIS